MNIEGCKAAILAAVVAHEKGNDKGLDKLARMLAEVDASRLELLSRGYGVAGMPLLDIVKSVP